MSEPSSFADHFSGHADQYAAARPTYPEELFKFLAKISPRHDLAWDCATGSGQAAQGLASYFDKVIATDASEEQIRNAASKADNVHYRTAAAEQSGIEENSINLVTVAQALHWFDFDGFYRRCAESLHQVVSWPFGAMD